MPHSVKETPPSTQAPPAALTVLALAGCGQTASDAHGGGEAGSGGVRKPEPCLSDCPCPSAATFTLWLETPFELD